MLRTWGKTWNVRFPNPFTGQPMQVSGGGLCFHAYVPFRRGSIRGHDEVTGHGQNNPNMSKLHPTQTRSGFTRVENNWNINHPNPQNLSETKNQKKRNTPSQTSPNPLSAKSHRLAMPRAVPRRAALRAWPSCSCSSATSELRCSRSPSRTSKERRAEFRAGHERWLGVPHGSSTNTWK